MSKPKVLPKPKMASLVTRLFDREPKTVAGSIFAVGDKVYFVPYFADAPDDDKPIYNLDAAREIESHPRDAATNQPTRDLSKIKLKVEPPSSDISDALLCTVLCNGAETKSKKQGVVWKGALRTMLPWKQEGFGASDYYGDYREPDGLLIACGEKEYMGVRDWSPGRIYWTSRDISEARQVFRTAPLQGRDHRRSLTLSEEIPSDEIMEDLFVRLCRAYSSPKAVVEVIHPTRRVTLPMMIGCDKFRYPEGKTDDCTHLEFWVDYRTTIPLEHIKDDQGKIIRTIIHCDDPMQIKDVKVPEGLSPEQEKLWIKLKQDITHEEMEAIMWMAEVVYGYMSPRETEVIPWQYLKKLPAPHPGNGCATIAA